MGVYRQGRKPYTRKMEEDSVGRKSQTILFVVSSLSK